MDKLTTAEMEVLLQELKGFLSTTRFSDVYDFARELLENKSVTFTSGVFKTRLCLFFKSTSEVLLSNAGLASQDWLKEIIDKEEGIEKRYFLFTFYHNSNSVLRLFDKRFMSGNVHPSYKPLINKYLQIYEQKKKSEIGNKVVDKKAQLYSDFCIQNQ